MSINFDSLTSFDSIISFVDFIIESFSNIWGFLNWTVGDFIDVLFGWIPFIGTGVATAVNYVYSLIIINGVSLKNLSLFVIMFGYGLFFYLVYQFGVWFLNLIN